MTSHIAYQRCFNHPDREAAARCPECRRYFCRECITEHEDRILCGSCLKKIYKKETQKRFGFSSLILTAQGLAGFLIVWLFFYYLGQILISIPASFHEGSIWTTGWWNIE